MNKSPELIVMLTYNDCTVENAYEIFKKACKSKAKFWGCKQEGIELHALKTLFSYMKECNKTTVLEVVAYTEEACLSGAKMAVACNCDILMGTIFFDSVNEYCKENRMKYMPFVGMVTGYPSVLEGGISEMIHEANHYLSKGVYGFDLLGYRYKGDAPCLNRTFVSQINAPVCLAGNIDNYHRLDEVRAALPRFFTIGSAFFENKFEGTFEEQINKVCDYMEKG